MVTFREYLTESGKDLNFAIQAQVHVEDSIESIKTFVKEGKLNKKYLTTLKQLLQDLSKIR